MDIPGSYLYAGTKHAVRVMTEGLRRELRDMKTKIRVTVSYCILP
jgi:NADP-dependent 3-hydroxy acid dehydrogenase YdfG